MEKYFVWYKTTSILPFEYFYSILLIVVCNFILKTISNFRYFRNISIIQNLIYLILTFISVAMLLLLFNIEFLGILYIIVYVGAILILFLFVVMLLDQQINNKNINIFYEKIITYINYIFFLFFIFLILYFFLFVDSYLNINNEQINYALSEFNNLELNKNEKN